MADVLAFGPILPALVAWIYRDQLPRGGWLLVAAFGMSTVGDMWTRLAGGAWYPSYLWLPVQLGLALVIVLPARVRIGWLTALGTLACYDILFVSGPELVVTAAGSVGIVIHAMRSGHRLAVPLLLYFGLGSVLYLGMVASVEGGGFIGWWWAYQGARVLAWSAFVVLVWQCARREPVRVQYPSDMMLYGPRMTPGLLARHPN